MKKTLIRILLATLMLVASGSTPILADGGDRFHHSVIPERTANNLLYGVSGWFKLATRADNL